MEIEEKTLEKLLDQNRVMRWGLIGLAVMLVVAALFGVYVAAVKPELPPLAAVLPNIPAPTLPEIPTVKCPLPESEPGPGPAGPQPPPAPGPAERPIRRPEPVQAPMPGTPWAGQPLPPPEPPVGVGYYYPFGAPPITYYRYRPYPPPSRFYPAPHASLPRKIGRGIAKPFRKLGGLFR